MSLLSPQDNIWEATRRGDLEAVCKFVQRGNVPDVEDDYDQQSLLTVACAAGHVEVVRYLWDRGCRSSCIVGRAPEAFAALENGHIDVLRLLCKRGLDPYSTRYSKHGDYLIHVAIEQRNVEIVRLLLARGAHIFDEYEDEATWEEREDYDKFPPPIEMAARAGDLEFVSFLLEVGVDLQGQTPDYYLHKARQKAPEFSRQKQDEVERALRDKLIAERNGHQADNELLGGCLTFLLGLIMLVWIVRQLWFWVANSF